MISGHFNPAAFAGNFSLLDHRPGAAWQCAGTGYEVQVHDEHVDAFSDAALLVLAIGAARRAGGKEKLSARAFAEAYAQQGAAVLSSLRGHYALLVLDGRRREVLLVGDRFATVSLCYAEQEGILHFATRADKLGVRLGREVCPQALFDYLYFHVVPAPRTAFRNVHRVDLAQVVSYSTSGLRKDMHWRPAFDIKARAITPELKEEFRSLVEAAVRHESAGQVTGCFLSGGTDSSTVAGMLTRVSGEGARTFSIGFDAAGYDEMEYARVAAKHFGTKHTEHYLTREELLSNIPLVAAAYDQPFGNSSAGAAYQCALAAKAAGVDKLLAGDGGDELFGGNTRYAKQRVFEIYGVLPGFARSTLEAGLAVPGVARLPIFSKAASYVEQARVPMPDRMNMYNLLWRLGVDNVLEPEFRAQIDIDSPAQQQREVYARTKGADLIDRMLAYDWKYTLADNDLPKVTGTVHLAGIDVGFPLLSDELLDFSATLDPDLKVRGYKLRHFFKEALRDFLPEEIILKQKHGFGLPFGVWALSHPGLRELAFDSLAALRGRGIVRPSFIDDLRDRLLPEHPGYYGEMVWILMMLEQWFAVRLRA
jgi:asparagine synthase (glutamine-hydrolysing)